MDEHTLAVDVANPAEYTPSHVCGEHDKAHLHGEDCGQPSVPYGDHVDYLVRRRLLRSRLDNIFV